MEYILFTLMLESVHNRLQAIFGFKKKTWKLGLKNIKKILKVKRKITVD